MDTIIERIATGSDDAPAILAPERPALTHGGLRRLMRGHRRPAQRARHRPRRPGGDRAAERAGDGDRLRLGRRGGDHRAAQPGLSRGRARLLPHRHRREGDPRRARRGRPGGRGRRTARHRRPPPRSPTRTAGRAASRIEGAAIGAAARPGWPRPDDIALLLHTSGTTSRPKLVPLSHANLAASAAHIGATLALDAGRPLPQHHAALPHPRPDRGGARPRSPPAAASFCTPGFNALRFFALAR